MGSCAVAALAGLWAAFVAGVCFHVIGTGQDSTAGRRGRVALGLSVWLWWNGSAWNGEWVKMVDTLFNAQHSGTA